MRKPMPPAAHAGQQDYVIESPRLLPFLIWLRDLILTLIVWALYIYLMQDFFYFITDIWHWAVGGFGDTSVYDSFRNVKTLKNYTMFVNIICVLFMFWSAYNIFRFAGKTRRRMAKIVSPADVADYYRVSQRQVMAWQKAGTLVIHHDGNGRLLEVAEV